MRRPRQTGARKGFITQCVCVLLDKPVEIDAVEKALAKFKVAGRRPGAVSGEDGWVFGGPAVVVAMRPEVNGYVLVDVVAHPWPDSMGDPGSESTVFGGWTTGQFGPCTWPGSLERARQHAYGWREGAAIAERHTGFIRLRTSYALNAPKDAPVWPDDYDSLPELTLISDLALALMELDGAVAYFCPGGEVLLAAPQLRGVRERHRGGGEPSIEAWSNVRMFRLDDIEPGRTWMLMDTVGMGQLDLPDNEAAFPIEGHQGSDVAGILRSVSAYDLAGDGCLSPGDLATDDGGTTWRVRIAGESLIDPPRAALRWFPTNVIELPPALAKTADKAAP